MENLKGKFGFGCMRLPMLDGEVDKKQFSQMVDEYLEAGFNYFDTAHGYIGGKSETALKECLTSRYPRESYILVDKLTGNYFESNEDIKHFFDRQLKATGVDYFDYYLMHAQNEQVYGKFKDCKAYETAFELKKKGKIKHVGISFHDKADVLEKILNDYPEIEVVQIQFNYVDYNDNIVEGKKCYDICVKHNKPIIVMEPVKGGNLANLPEDAKSVLDELNGGTPASYAMRYVGSFEAVQMILSGVSNLEQLRENIDTMKNFKALDDREYEAIEKVVEIFNSKNLIPCTDCKYCVSECPKNILIPNLFGCLNSKKVFNNWNTDFYYSAVYTVNNGKASACIKCKKCEKVCPQFLKISELLVDVAGEFDKN